MKKVPMVDIWLTPAAISPKWIDFHINRVSLESICLKSRKVEYNHKYRLSSSQRSQQKLSKKIILVWKFGGFAFSSAKLKLLTLGVMKETCQYWTWGKDSVTCNGFQKIFSCFHNNLGSTLSQWKHSVLTD